MNNLAKLSALALSSTIAATSFAQCAPRCGKKCGAKCPASWSQAKCASKCGPKCSAKCGAKCGPKCGAKCAPKCSAKAIQRPAGYKPSYKLEKSMVSAGEVLFKNTKLSSNGMACATCHTAGGSYQKTFAKPYPHFVQMAKDGYGLSKVHLDEAIQMCMLGPMAAKPFDWKSVDLQNLSAFILSEQEKFSKR